MRPISLTVKGLRSYREQVTIDFEGLDLFAVIGDTGAGKSTIIEALSFALYAKKTWTGGSLGDLVAHGQNDAVVELVFEADGRVWKVLRKRGVKAGGAVDRLSCEGESGSTDGADAVNDRITALLGLDHGQFINAVVMRQGNFDKLLTLKPGERTTLLSSIFGLDHLATVQTWARDQHKLWNDKLIKATERRAALPPDPEAERATAARLLAESEERRRVLAESRDALTQHETARDAAVRAVERLGDRLRLVPGDGQGALGALAAAWAEAVALLEEREAAVDALESAEARLAALQADEKRALCGFADRDAAVRAETTVLALADELTGLAEKLDEIEGSIAWLDDQPDAGTVDPVLSGAVKVAEEAEREAEEVATATRAALEEARRLWSSWSEAATRLRSLITELGQTGDAEKRAADRRAAGQAAVEAARDALLAAEEARDAAVRADAVAHVVAGLAAGDACPVCEHPVDEAHLARHRRAGSGDASAAVTAAQRASQQAVAEAAQAEAAHSTATERVAALTRQLEACEAELERLDTPCRTAGLAMVADDEAASVARLQAAAGAAAEGLAVAHDATVSARAALAAAQATIEATVRTRAEQTANLEAQRVKVLGSIAVAQQKVAWLPAGFVDPAAITPEELRFGSTKIDAVLADVTAVQQMCREAEADLAARRAVVTGLDERARTEVLTPAGAALSSLMQWAAPLRELAAEVPAAVEQAARLATIEAPRRVGEVDAVQAKASALVEAGTQVLAAAEASLLEQQSLVERAKTAVADVLRVAGVESGPALENELGGVTQLIRQANDDLARADLAVESAARLDTQLATLRPVVGDLDTLRTSLTSGAFVTHLLDSRTAELLTEAGRRLGEITSGAYDFTEEFEVIEMRTGAVRSPDMLSGGERFQAALALSLGLVEIASRGGGKLGAVFVDEGFGSLDTKSLAKALDTLGGVAGGGKMVGLVSHLRPVAEYVDTVFHVVKDDARGSLIERLEGADREALIFRDDEAGLAS